MEEKNIHKGHRDRMKNKFLKNGLESFENHEILELLLYYSIARRDTNPIGHELLKRFGSISGVFDANYEELMSVKGISEHSAVLIKLIPQLAKSYIESKQTKGAVSLTSMNEIYDFCRMLFVGKLNEEFYVICMDKRSEVITYRKISEGLVDETPVNMRKLVEIIVKSNACKVILTHNHPSGTALPSKSDIMATKNIRTVLNGINVVLFDHIIVSKYETVSFAQMNII